MLIANYKPKLMSKIKFKTVRFERAYYASREICVISSKNFSILPVASLEVNGYNKVLTYVRK